MTGKTPQIYQAFAPFYAEFWGKNYAGKVDPFLFKLLCCENHVCARKIVDVCCGSGDVAARLASRGYRVVGLDASTDLLSLAKRKLPSGLFLPWRFGQPLPRCSRGADAAICLYDSLNYAPCHSVVAETVREIASALAPGGLLVLDVNTPEGLKARWKGEFTVTAPFGECRCRFSTDASGRRATMTAAGWIETPLGHRAFEEIHEEIGLVPASLVALLRRCGIIDVHVLEAARLGMTRESGRAFIVARSARGRRDRH